MKSLKRQIGLDILSDKYSYGTDPEYGYTSAQKIPDRWVSTTCGYCSVGCGMFVGVKDNRTVAVRGNPNHPVNLGKLCPKGLSEHHTLEASNRAKHPLLRKNGKLERISWDEAIEVMVEKFRATQEKHGRDSLGVISTGQLVTEEFY
ncbi:MAG TPA: molybdopterin-dependent oxidoreductase, partial [Terriglobales bacterium]